MSRLAARCVGTALAALAVVGTAGCTRDRTNASDAERFCGEAIAHRDLIVSPPVATEDELAATLEFHHLMADLAPLAIAAEWATLVRAYETASQLVPGDEASEQRVAMTAYATEPAAYAVKVWLERNCGLDIPITTIAPQAAPEPELPVTSGPDATTGGSATGTGQP